MRKIKSAVNIGDGIEDVKKPDPALADEVEGELSASAGVQSPRDVLSPP